MTKQKIKWHKGPPPHIGWWVASLCGYEKSWRWWDGVAWSHSALPTSPINSVAFWSMKHAPQDDKKKIRWSDYYPKNARVPRIDPRKGGEA